MSTSVAHMLALNPPHPPTPPSPPPTPHTHARTPTVCLALHQQLSEQGPLGLQPPTHGGRRKHVVLEGELHGV